MVKLAKHFYVNVNDVTYNLSQELFMLQSTATKGAVASECSRSMPANAWKLTNTDVTQRATNLIL